jgi:RHS repeat-associated protein
MERDASSGNDYDHARFHGGGSALGRFLSPDPGPSKPEDPRTWDRYSYVANNPLRFIDEDGRALKPADQARLDRNAAIRNDVADFLNRTGNGLFVSPVETVLWLALPDSNEEIANGLVATVAGFAAPIEAPTGEFSIVHWADYPESLPRPEGPVRILQGEEYTAARQAADSSNRALHAQDPSLKGMQIHEIKPVKFGGSPTDPKNKIPLTPAEHARVTTWWNKFLKAVKDYVSVEPK